MPGSRCLAGREVVLSFHVNIVQEALRNTAFRRVLHTTPLSQLVVMCVEVGDDIGLESHELDQVLVIVEGEARYHVGEHHGVLSAGDVLVVPARAMHNVINSGERSLKLYTLYTPPEHAPGTVHKTRDEAIAAEADHHRGVQASGSGSSSRVTVGSLLGLPQS